MKNNLHGALGLITAAAGVVAICWSAFNAIATKDFHREDLAPMQKSIENIEASAVVQRIRGLLRSRCAGGLPIELQILLVEQLSRYEELTGREFRQGTCEGGVWISASGAPG